jgi:hypothetical protein
MFEMPRQKFNAADNLAAKTALQKEDGIGVGLMDNAPEN